MEILFHFIDISSDSVLNDIYHFFHRFSAVEVKSSFFLDDLIDIGDTRKAVFAFCIRLRIGSISLSPKGSSTPADIPAKQSAG